MTHFLVGPALVTADLRVAGTMAAAESVLMRAVVFLLADARVALLVMADFRPRDPLLFKAALFRS